MISYNGFNNNFLTFNTDTKLGKNTPVKVVAGDKVEACSTNDIICGVIASGSDDAASVQINGYVELPCTDATMTLGYVSVCADSAGGVKKGTGRQVLVVKVDTTDNICGFIL